MQKWKTFHVYSKQWPRHIGGPWKPLPRNFVSSGGGREGGGSSSDGGGDSSVKQKDRAMAAAREYQSKQETIREGGLFADREEEYIWQPLGVGLLAEAQIQASIRKGGLQNLKGKGKPLPAEDSSSQFFRVDPSLPALMRTLGAQNLRPESLERRDALRKARAQFEGRVKELLAAEEKGSQKWTGVKAGRDEGIRFLFEEYQRAGREYSIALLKDKETFQGWPLLSFPTLDYAVEVQQLLDTAGCG